MKKFGKKAVALVTVATLAMTSLVGCTSVDDSKIVATVGDSDITAGLANFYMRYQQASIESMYASYYGEDFWSMEIEEGVTFEEKMKDSVMDILQELYILEDHMDEYEVSLSEEELAAIDEAAASLVEANEDDAKKKVSADKEYVVEYLKLITISKKMNEVMIGDVNREVSDEEAAQKKMRYVAFETVTTAEDGSTTEMTEDEIVAVKAEAEKFLAGAKASGSMEAYAIEIGVETAEQTFDAESIVLDEAVIKAADALEEGAFAELIETENGYYVVQLESLLDREATDAEKENIIAERESERYTELVESWKEETEISVNESVWKKISFKALKVTAKEEEAEDTDATENTETSEDAGSSEGTEATE